jgi:Ca2+-binding EF-hand superfamily protein
MADENTPLSAAQIDACEEAMGKFYEEDDDDQLPILFKLFDINGDGFISKNELMTVMKSVSGEHHNEEEIEAMFNEADTD